jgi:outer membrane receptor protein involved in Fe transport
MVGASPSVGLQQATAGEFADRPFSKEFLQPHPTPPSMKPAPHSAPSSTAVTLALCLSALTAMAQTAPAPQPRDNDKDPEGPATLLSPFEVNTSRDTGFAATSALAGGRLATDLRDTPVSYSVMTREFLDALAIDDLQTAAAWAPNSQSMPDDGGNNFFTFTTMYATRGVRAGTQQRNFFPQNGDNDTYNIERFDFARGPNSILFGNGSLGGTSSSTTKRARTDKAFQNVQFRLGSWDSVRTTLDINQPLGDDNRLAMRGVLMWQDTNGWRDKTFDKREGAFLTTTYRPFRNTEIRLEGEYLKIGKQTAMTKLNDRLAGWDGQLTYSSPAALRTANAAMLNAATVAGVNRRPANYFVYDPYNGLNAIMNLEGEPMTRGGAETATTPIAGYTYGASGGGTFNTTGAGFDNVLGVPTGRFDNALANSKFFIPGEEFTISPDAPLVTSHFKDVQLTINHQIGDFYFEAAGDINRQTYFVNGEENRGTSDTYIDINSVLPDGSSNPHFLEPYGDGQYFRGYRHYNNDNFRLAAAYLKDTRFGSFGINTMAGINDANYDITYRYLSMGLGDNKANWTRDTQFVRIRRYWSETDRPLTDPSAGSINYVNPGSPIAQIQPVWVADSRPNINSINQSKYKYGLVSLNAKLFKEKLVLLGAVRRDSYFISSLRQANVGDWPANVDPAMPLFLPNAPADWNALTYVPKNTNGVPTDFETVAQARPRSSNGTPLPQYANDRFQDDYSQPPISGLFTTKSLGSVYHLNDWISPFINYAETFNPSPAYYLLIDGNIIPPTIAKGMDYGLRFELFDRRLSIVTTYYENTERNNRATVTGGTPPFNTLFSARPQGSDQEMNNRGQSLLPSYQDLSKRHAEGFEIEAVANLTKALRITASYSQPKVYLDDANSMTRAFIDSHGEVFKAIAQDANVAIDSTNIASVDTSVPADIRSPDAQAAADAYNTIYERRASFIEGRVLSQDQTLIRLFADYAVQSGPLKDVRVGVGYHYDGRRVIGNRASDTIVNPANPATAIDDPDRDVHTLVYAPHSTSKMIATVGYSFKLFDRPVTANLIVDNILDDGKVIYVGTSQRPRDGDYASPAREAVPNGFSYVTPINYRLTLGMTF